MIYAAFQETPDSQQCLVLEYHFETDSIVIGVQDVKNDPGRRRNVVTLSASSARNLTQQLMDLARMKEGPRSSHDEAMRMFEAFDESLSREADLLMVNAGLRDAVAAWVNNNYDNVDAIVDALLCMRVMIARDSIRALRTAVLAHHPELLDGEVDLTDLTEEENA